MSTAPTIADRGYEFRRRRAGWLFVTPALLVLVLVLLYPIVQSLVLSFRRVSTGQGVLGGEWAGVDNYTQLFASAAFRTGLFNTLYFTVAEVVAVLFISLLFALLLSHPRVKSPFFLVILLIPWAIAPVANATIWKWIYNGNYGILNSLLKALGLIDENIVWLGSPQLAMNMLLLADIWKAVPFITLLLIAGCKGIPPVLYRAAIVDGASAWQRFRFVTLPLLRPTLMIVAVLQTIWAMKVFDLIYVLTKGGPADGTVTLNFLAYRTAFNFGDMGSGSAVATILFVLMFLAALVYLRVLSPRRRKAGAR